MKLLALTVNVVDKFYNKNVDVLSNCIFLKTKPDSSTHCKPARSFVLYKKYCPKQTLYTSQNFDKFDLIRFRAFTFRLTSQYYIHVPLGDVTDVL